ncbi:hypothetical protein, partial [Teichococcus aerofrigidensis]
MDPVLSDPPAEEARLVAHLAEGGLLAPAALRRAEEARQAAGEALIPALLALGLLGEEPLAAAAAPA